MTTATVISATRGYSYNGDGTLVGQVANGTTTRYAQDLAAGQAQVLAATSGSCSRPGGTCGCFPGDTGVATPHGLVAIASLKVGDAVLAEDPGTGKAEPERVPAVIDNGIKPLVAVGLSDGTSLNVTTNRLC